MTMTYIENFTTEPPHSPTNVCFFYHGRWQNQQMTPPVELLATKQNITNHDSDQPMHCAMLLSPNKNKQMFIQHAMVQDVYNIITHSRLKTHIQSQDEEWSLRMLRWILEPHCSIKAPEISFFVTQEPNVLFFTKSTMEKTCSQYSTAPFRIIMT